MRFTVSILAAALLLGLFYMPKNAFGQNKDKIVELQRELYDVNKSLMDLKEGQSAQGQEIRAQLKQVLDLNTKLSADVRDLQQKLADQQKRLIDPMAATRKAVDDLWSSVSAVESSVNSMRTKQDKMSDMLTNVSGQLGLMRDDMGKNAPPPGATEATVAFAAAERERLTGNLQFALGSFLEISQKYPMTPEAPMAVFEIGSIYAQNGQYKDAVDAYDRVLEQFGENPMRKPAQFQKAAQLANMGRNSDAAREFDTFARQYPGDDNAPEALQRARELRAGSSTSKSKQPAAKQKNKK